MRFVKFQGNRNALYVSRKQPRYVTENHEGENVRENAQFPENGGRNTFSSVARRNFFSGPRRSRESERLGPRGSRHNTSHYVIRASLDTAIYHSSARTPIYRSSPYACKTLPASPLRPFRSSLSMSSVERKEGRKALARARKTIGRRSCER